MSDVSERLRSRLLPAIVTALGVTFLAAGLLTYTTPVDAGPTTASPTTEPSIEPTPTALISLPPLGSAPPPASPSAPADRVVTRVRIQALGIDLPVVPPPDGSDYPLCNVAMWFGDMDRPGAGRATYLYAHAREGMFLPLLDASRINNGQRMIGMVVEVWTSDDQHFLYEIQEVHRHVPFDQGLTKPLASTDDELWLQTSEGPGVPKGQRPNPKLQVVASFLSQEGSAHADAHPKARPVVCG